jgi:hypothetical protein
MDRPEQVGADLVYDLFVRQRLGRAEETAAGAVHDNVNPAEVGEGLFHDCLDRRSVGYVEMSKPQPVAVFGLE